MRTNDFEQHEDIDQRIEIEKRLWAIKNKYDELVLAVGNKYKGETRHETALRYIKEAEDRPPQAQQKKELEQ